MVSGALLGAAARRLERRQRRAPRQDHEPQRGTHIVCFTDSSAAEGAINSGNSPSLQMNAIIQWLFSRLPGVQFSAIHQPGCRNTRADGISRSEGAAVLASVIETGAEPWPLDVDDDSWEALRRAWSAPQKHRSAQL